MHLVSRFLKMCNAWCQVSGGILLIFRRTLCWNRKWLWGEYGTRHFSDVTIKKITDGLVWGSGWPINVSISGYGTVTANIRLTAAIDTQSTCKIVPSCWNQVFSKSILWKNLSFCLKNVSSVVTWRHREVAVIAVSNLNQFKLPAIKNRS